MKALTACSGVGIGRDAGLVQEVRPLAHGRAAEPGGQDGLRRGAGLSADLPGHGRRIGHGLRGDDDQQGVDAGIPEHDLGRFGHELRFGVAEDVDGIAAGPVTAAGSASSSASVASDKRARVPPEATSASVAMTPGPPAFVSTARRGPLGTLCRPTRSAQSKISPMLKTRARPMRSKAASKTASSPARAPGVGGRRGRGLGEASGLVGDDGLHAGEGPGGGHELPGVRDGLDIKKDGLGRLVLAEVIDEVAEIDVDHVAGRDEVREAELLLGRPVEDRRAERPGLRDEGDVAGPGHGPGEAGVEGQAGGDDAEAVGAEDPQAIEPAGFREDGVLEGPPGRPGLAEPGRDDDQAADAGLAAFADEPRHLGRGGADDAEVRRLGQRGRAREAGDAHHGFDRWADGIDDAAESAADEIGEDPGADALRVRADARRGRSAGA